MKRFLLSVFILFWCWPVLANDVLLENVTFKSQSPPGDWDDNMNCGPTSAVMLASTYLEIDADEDEIKIVIDWLYDNEYIQPQLDAEYYDGNSTSITQIANVLTGKYKLGPVVKKNIGQLSYLQAKLEKDNPVMVAVNVQMDPTKMGHFMVVVGLTEDNVVVHDPGKTQGSFNSYSYATFLASWKTSNYASLVVDTSKVTWHPDGSLVQVIGNAKVYILIDSKTYWIKNEAVFNAHNYDWQKIISISQKEFNCIENYLKLMTSII